MTGHPSTSRAEQLANFRAGFLNFLLTGVGVDVQRGGDVGVTADLLDRLMEGKISGKGQRLTETKLAALRELALRRTADRLDRLPDKAKKLKNSSKYHMKFKLSLPKRHFLMGANLPHLFCLKQEI